MSRRPKILVVGAGVIGLTTAHELSDWCDVEIVAEKIGVASDSWKATAIWHVYLVPETEQVLAWAAQSLEQFLRIAAEHAASGVELVNGVELFRRGEPHVPSWAHIPPLFELLTGAEVARYNVHSNVSLGSAERQDLQRNPVTWGYKIAAPAVSMLQYLPWLQGEVEKRKVRIQEARLSSLPAGDGYDAIVNCAGYGSAQLAKDNAFEIYRGQYFVLKRDETCPAFYVGDDDHPGGMAYAIPRGTEVMVGGCAEKDQLDLKLTISWDDVVSRAALYFPWLTTKTERDFAMPPVVCLRPARAGGVRLELESRNAGVPIVHNYGHGGSGFSLSWGCATSVGEILRQFA